jgi:hypothetical protein
MDIPGDDAGVWMTYDQLADTRDIKRDGARRLAQRHRWRRQTGNDGLARVLVPSEWLTTRGDSTRDIAGDTPAAPDSVAPDIAGVVAALQAAFEKAMAEVREAKDGEIATLRDTVEGLRSTVARTEHRAQHAEARATESEANVRDAESRVRDATEAARIATDALNVVRRADEARRGKGRLRRAWDGWRGR